MAMPSEQPATLKPKLRWYHLTPGRLLIVLLVVEGVLLITNWFEWTPKGWAVLIAVAAVGTFLLLMLLWFVLALLFHWRFQFSIRLLLMLTVAVAIPCSWLAVEMKWAREQKELAETLAKRCYKICYDYEWDKSTRYRQKGAKPLGWAWLRKTLGDDFFSSVDFIDLYEVNLDAEMENLKNVKQLKWLVLDGATEKGLERIAKELSQLQYLSLRGTALSETELERLKELKQLKNLSLDLTKVTDDDLKCLKGIIYLKNLDLRRTQITDANLEILAEMAQLDFLCLPRDSVTDAGVAKLQKALPNCMIDH